MDTNNIERLFQTRYVHLVMGQPQMGKTSLLLSLMYSLGVIKHIPVFYISLEESYVQTMRKLISFAHGKMCGAQADISQEILDKLGSSQIHINDTSHISIDEVYSEVNQLIEDKQNLEYVLIDDVNLMKSEGITRQKEWKHTISKLSHLADTFNLSVICTCRINPFPSMKYFDDGIVNLTPFEDSIPKIAARQNILQYVIDRPNYLYTNYIDNGYCKDNSKGVVNLHTIIPYGNIHSFKFNYELAMLENLNKHQ